METAIATPLASSMLNCTRCIVDGGATAPHPHPGHFADLLITVAYFSIPFQILCSLYRFPFLKSMPPHVVQLLVLFALFIFLCGAGHLLHHLQLHDTVLFEHVNALTALVSVTTALYLLPIIPSLFSTIDASIKESIQLNHETAESKDKLVAFMAFLCHEIRNPLFAITSSVQSLREDYTWTGEPADCLECIHDASLLMLRLVNDVLDLSKMDAGKLTLEERNFDFHRLLQNMQTCIEKQLEGMHGDDVRLEFRVQPNVPQVLFGDSTRILQIVYNILSNSVKFTTHGRIGFDVRITYDPPEAQFVGDGRGGATLNGATEKARSSSKSSSKDRARRTRTSTEASLTEPHHDSQDSKCDNVVNVEMESLVMEEGRQASSEASHAAGHWAHEHNNESPHSQRRTMLYLHISCQDTGVGIAPDRIKTIFEPYSQAKLSDYRKHGGTGLGLSVISSLLRVMGGSIQVESEVGVGSTFHLVIPMLVPSDQDPSPSTAADAYVVNDAELPQTRALPHEPLVMSTSFSPSEESSNVSSNHVVAALADAADLIAPSTPSLSPSPQKRRSRRNSMDSDTLRATRRLPPLFDGSDSSFKQDGSDEASSVLVDASHTITIPSPDPVPYGWNEDFWLESDGASDGGEIESVACHRGPRAPISLALASVQALSSVPCTAPESVTDQAQANCLDTSRINSLDFGEAGNCDGDSNGVAGMSYSNKVLVADDNVVNRKIIGKMLTNFGIDFDLAAHGEEAVDRVRSQAASERSYGLVFMDLSMPVMDGYDAIQIIRLEFPTLPIVALTANALTQEKQRAIQAGATEFKTKPILRHDLLAVCQKYLLPQREEKRASSKSQTIVSPRDVSAVLVD